jgi:hypothetical protein
VNGRSEQELAESAAMHVFNVHECRAHRGSSDAARFCCIISLVMYGVNICDCSLMIKY